MRGSGPERDPPADPERVEALDETLPSRDTPVPSRPPAASLDTMQLAPTIGSAPPVRDSGPALERGAKLGRYVVERTIGAGAMGVVVLARDPSLARNVAIKIVRGDPVGTTVGRQRLVREAQAMAQLSHPNVVTVFEVGMLDDRVFIAMEYVDGTTLAEWLAAEQRPRRAIIDAFVAAGRGLAAAHGAGIVHRDFKPANVLVARDGRIRVADFGLAIAEGSRRAQSHAEPVHRDSLQLSMTATGALLGTPGYMAPEQHRAEAIDARADQFAFCVALYEALYGELPFEGRGYHAYTENVLAGRIREPSRARSVSSRLRRVLVRGLAVAPGERYPSMDALLRDLERAAAGRGRALAVAGVAAVGAAGVALALALGGEEPPDPCAAAERAGTALWSPAVRARVEEAFVRSSARDASVTLGRLDTLLAARARELGAMRREACEATARHEQSTELRELRMACLDRRGLEITALVDVLATSPEQALVDRAVQAAQALPSARACADGASLLGALPPPAEPGMRAQVDALERRLTRAETLERAGKFADALEVATAVSADADALGYAPLRARARMAMAVSLNGLARHDEVAATLREATPIAAAARDDAMLARMWILLYGTVGYQLSRPAEAAQLEPVVAAALERAGSPEELRGNLANARGAIALGAGDYARAAEQFAAAVEHMSRGLGPTHLKVATSLQNQGLALGELARHDEARAALEQALAIHREVLGENHPSVAHGLKMLGSQLDVMGQPAEALELLRRAHALQQRTLPEGHPSLAYTANSIGVVLERLERCEDAIGVYEEGIALLEKRSDEAGVAARMRANVASCLGQLGRHAEALAMYERALEALERTLGGQHPAVGNVVCGLGSVAGELGDHARQRAMCQRALDIYEASLGPEHPNLAGPLHSLATGALRRRKPAEALPWLSRAQSILDKAGQGETATYGDLLLLRGRALSMQRKHAEAIASAERGVALVRAHAGPKAVEAAEATLAQVRSAAGR